MVLAWLWVVFKVSFMAYTPAFCGALRQSHTSLTP